MTVNAILFDSDGLLPSLFASAAAAVASSDVDPTTSAFDKGKVEEDEEDAEVPLLCLASPSAAFFISFSIASNTPRADVTFGFLLLNSSTKAVFSTWQKIIEENHTNQC
jgi:hypothetical protein